MLRRIYDPIFGIIKFENKIESDIINSPIFQRLRDIKQLGMVHCVYPTATHSRFSHSIGVMHLANKIANTLKEKDNQWPEQDTDLQNLRMAAILHDVGHFPFSHVCEISKDDELSIELPTFLREGHESLSTYLIQNSYINDILEKNHDVELICGLITNRSAYPVLNNIINWELDADRLDYLLRDSYFTGVRLGGIDYHYLINNFDVDHFKFKRHNSEEIEELLIIDKKASRSVENFLIARYSLYDRVYLHEKILYYDYLLKKLFFEYIEDLIPDFMKDTDKFNEIISSKEKSKKYNKFSDSSIIQKLHKVYQKLEGNTEYKKILKLDLDSLLFRKKNDVIKSFPFTTKMPKIHCNSIKDSVVKIINDLKKSFDFMEHNIAVNIPGNYFTKLKGLNYSMFGLEYMFEEESDKERTKSITIKLKNNELKNFFEWKDTYFYRIHDHKTIKFNIYIKDKKEFLDCFRDNAEQNIIELINA